MEGKGRQAGSKHGNLLEHIARVCEIFKTYKE
ncbi:hypothetical protein EC9_27220 [Rosistilla ulvae]|uniref:Uncharacterized protein n=1 Tax=Rosistilla ulvae TaxID=1930277 RepID=A0A517M0X1_9BACT|nr:hypothetical protein EC9_27220 [Rosistilla ulvae]